MSYKGRWVDAFTTPISTASIKWKYLEDGIDLQFYSGLVGMTYEPETGFTPVFGYAICDAIKKN